MRRQTATSIFSLAALALLARTPVLHAQTIRGRLVTADSTRSISGAIVLLRDSSNADVARMLSGPDGSFVFRLAKPGSYRIRTLRIGFRPADYGPYRVSSAEDLRLLLPLANIPVSLATITVSANTDCRAGDEGGEATLTLWEEARKALLTTVLTRMDRDPIVTVANYERVSDAASNRIRSQVVHHLRGPSTRPYVSPLVPDEYTARGYVEDDGTGLVYRAPDADVLLSDGFAANHCFRIVGSPTDSTRVGLTFRPTRREPRHIEVSGTLWMDRTTGELRTLEFRYAGLTDIATNAGAGGWMDFVRLPAGGWVIARWELTAPRVVTTRGFHAAVTTIANPSSSSRPATTRDSLAELWRTGGAVLRVTVGQTDVWHGKRAQLTGRVLDDGDGHPISGARITLQGTNYAASADSLGVFAINDILPGEYKAETHSPALDALGLDVPTIESVDLRDTIPASATIHVLAIYKAVARLCGMSDTLVAMRGVVEGPTRTPAAGALVVASWFGSLRISESTGLYAQRLSATTTTSADGSFRLCGLPADHLLRLIALRDSARSDTVSIRIARTAAIVTVDLSLTRAGPRVSADGLAMVEGTIRDEAGKPIAGVEIEVFGMDATHSDSAGRYSVGRLESGSHLMRVRRVGSVAQVERVTLEVAERQTHDVTLRSVQALEGVNITAKSMGGVGDPDGIIRRRETGHGAFLTEEQIVERRAQTMEDLLRGMPGLRIEHSITLGGTYIVQDRGELTIQNQSCKGVGLFIDGAEITQPFEINQISPRDTRAVEYYSGPATTPPELRSPKAVCGTLAIWTK